MVFEREETMTDFAIKIEGEKTPHLLGSNL